MELKTDNKSDMNVDLLWVKPFRITVKRELCEYFSLNRVKIRMHSPYTYSKWGMDQALS